MSFTSSINSIFESLFVDSPKDEGSQGKYVIAKTNDANFRSEVLIYDSEPCSHPESIGEGVDYRGSMVLERGIEGATKYWRLYGSNNNKFQNLVDLAEISKFTRVFPEILQAEIDMPNVRDNNDIIHHIVTIGSEDTSFIKNLQSIYKEEVAGYRRCVK